MFDAKELLNVLTGGNPGPRAEAATAAANDALERGKQVATDAPDCGRSFKRAWKGPGQTSGH